MERFCCCKGWLNWHARTRIPYLSWLINSQGKIGNDRSTLKEVISKSTSANITRTLANFIELSKASFKKRARDIDLKYYQM